MENNVNQNGDIGWVSTLKATCILLVVLFHVTEPGFASTVPSLSAGRQIALCWEAFNTHLSPFRMPAFFFVSGLLAQRSIFIRSWRELTRGRLANLLYLYLLWCLLQWLAIQYIIHAITGQQISPNTNAIYASSLSSLISLTLKGMSSAWYIYALFGYLLVTKLGKGRTGPLLALGLLLNTVAALKLVPGWGPQSLCLYFIYFALGACVSSRIVTLSRARIDSIPAWLLLLGGALALRAAGLSHNLFASTLAILLAIASCRTLNAHLPMWRFNRLGRITLPVYVLHRILIELFGMLAIQYGDRHGFAHPLFSLAWAAGYPPLMALLCAGAALGLWKMADRGLGRWLFALPSRSLAGATT